MTYTFDRVVADSVRDEMAAVTRQLTIELDNMDRQVRATLADWQDGAKEAYDKAMVQCNAAMTRMPTSLGRAEVVLNEITEGYLKIEHTGANAWGGFSMK